jgi:hypothetical protein
LSRLFDAEILPCGADWRLAGSDGAIEIDTRYSARTRPVSMSTSHPDGRVRSGPPNIPEALLRGEVDRVSCMAYRVT